MRAKSRTVITLSLENTMSDMQRFALPAALILALSLSACASKPVKEEPAPAPVAVAEPAPAPVAEAVPAPAPAQVASVQEEAPKPVVKKAKRKKVAKAAPKVVEPAPVVEAPAPTAAAAVQEPTPAPAPMVEAPITPVEEKGFFAKYWSWLLGLILAIIAIVFMTKKKE